MFKWRDIFEFGTIPAYEIVREVLGHITIAWWGMPCSESVAELRSLAAAAEQLAQEIESVLCDNDPLSDTKVCSCSKFMVQCHGESHSCKILPEADSQVKEVNHE